MSDSSWHCILDGHKCKRKDYIHNVYEKPKYDTEKVPFISCETFNVLSLTTV